MEKEKMKLPVTCPLCGRKNEFPIETLVQGSILACPFCKVKLTLHGHMWEEIKADLQKLEKNEPEINGL
jgi:hypothetical protein